MTQLQSVGTESLLEIETQMFLNRTPTSKEIFEKAIQVVPSGVHSNYRFTDPYPLFITKSNGSKLWDADGNEYLDFNMGFGALVTGHSHPKLTEAVTEQIRELGTIYGFEYSETVKLADLMCRRFSVDRIKFSSTGAEGTMHAIRFARAFTKRNKILKFEGCYHGSHDGLLVSVKPAKEKSGSPLKPNPVSATLGMPQNVVSNTIVAMFNDLYSVESQLRENSGSVAAVILEPIAMNMGFVMPDKGFLEGLRDLCNQYDCLLIFDEVKTCGKYYGGASERFRVIPDLKVFGKGIAGGFPLSAVGGRADIMDIVVPGSVSHAGTFNANPLSILAGLVTLRDILTEQKMTEIRQLGQSLARGYADIIHDSKLKAHVQSDGISGAVAFSESIIRNWRDFQQSDTGKWSMYYTMMVNRGIIPAGTGPDEQWTVSAQHSPSDIDIHLRKFQEICDDLETFRTNVPIVESI